MDFPRYTFRDVERIASLTETQIRRLVRDKVIRKLGRHHCPGQFSWNTLVTLYNGGHAPIRADVDEAGVVVRFWPRSPGAAFYRLTVTFDVCGGMPCIANTRIPTAIVAERFRAGDSIPKLLHDYELLERLDIVAALLFEGVSKDVIG